MAARNVTSQKKTEKTSTKTTGFVTVKEAAKTINYSADYIARLARKGHVAAEQRGRQWYVSLESLKRFSLEQQAEQRARQELLRKERLQEYARKQLPQPAAVVTQASQQQVWPAALLTFVAAACLGLVVTLGVSGYRANLQSAELFSGARAVLSLVGDVLPDIPRAWVSTAEGDEAMDEPSAQQTYDSHKVIITEEGIAVAEGTAVSDVVSDPVVVSEVGTSSMVLTPVFTPEVEGRYTVELVTEYSTSIETP